MNILKDERYIEFVSKFQHDPLMCAMMVFGMTPSMDQIDLFDAIAPDNAKVSVVSGTSTGKTSAFARIAMWHMLCFPTACYEGKLEIGSNTYIGAPRINQVSDGVWKEINDTRMALLNGEYAWLDEYIVITKTKIYVKDYEAQWFISQVAMQAGQSIGVAGKHRYWQLIIIDEAAGVPDEHHDVIDGTQTQGGNRTLMASQGVKNSGRFYETHYNLSDRNGGSWRALTFSSENSPFVTKKWLRDREVETGGRHTIEFIIRVLGGFAEDSGSNLLTRSDIEKAFEYRQIIADDEPYGLVVLADVGLGEYRDESVAVVAKIIGYGDHDIDARRVEFMSIPLCTNSKNEIDFSGDLVNIVGLLSNATLLVDNGGVGATVSKLIEASGVPVTKVNWGKPCFKKEYKERFYNRRACGMVRLRDAIRSGRAMMPQGLSTQFKEKIKLQGSRLPYHFAEMGGLRYQMDRKEVMRAAGIKSPDIFDAFAFAFLEDCTYMVADNAALNAKGSAIDVAKKAADDLFADIEDESV